MKLSLIPLLLAICSFFSPIPLDALPLFTTRTEARIAYFQPTSSKVKKTYSDGWLDYQLELSQDLLLGLQAWGGVSWSYKQGHSTKTGSKTNLHLIPTQLGLKYAFSILPRTQLYVGVGACYSYLHVKDHSPHVHHSTSKGAYGGIFRSGFYLRFSECFLFTAFADYFYQNFHFSHSKRNPSIERGSLNLSGYKTGAGFGMTF